MNRAHSSRLLGLLTSSSAIQDCVVRRRQFEAEHSDATIVAPARLGDRWRVILPMGVLPADATTLGANSLCDLMDKLDGVYSPGG